MSQRTLENLLPDPAAILCSKASDGGAYVDLDGDGRLWLPTGRVFFHSDPQAGPDTELAQATRHFFQPRRFEDPFGFSNTADFDDYDLLAVGSTDTFGNKVSASNDYRVLQAQSTTDANGNRSQVVFDTLGLVAGSAVMGKTSENLGDNLAGFQADLTTAEIERFFAAPKSPFAAEILAQASTRIVYDTD
ncbi:MAG: hypothetical protein ABI171_09350, partial [Collimonas sp.]|uniref:hypothetical protein n=1 Tax=Collimonas sp. TaxID=1963772 RepID=UPI003267F542